MSRDMKPRKTQPARKKSGGGTLVGMFIGLVLGVAIAAGVVLYLNRSPLPFTQKPAPAKAEAPAAPAAGKAAPAPASQEPLVLPGKPGDPVPEKRFQFYDILPGKSEPKPDKQGAAEPRKEETKKEEPRKEEGRDSKTPLFLQAGSFSSAQEADNQKAKLAFLGHEAVVQQVMVQEKTFYRVRVGPFLRIDELNKARSDLAKAGIEAQLVKNKE